MVVQRRPSRSCSILIWGGFLLLYAALMAIIDCTQSNGTTTTIVPLSSTDKQFSSSATPTNAEVVTQLGDEQTTLPSQSSPLTGNVTTESSSVIIIIVSFHKNINQLILPINIATLLQCCDTIFFIDITVDFDNSWKRFKRTIILL